ncbi:alginate lyase family protein [Larkinella sp. VNQ87]|uniref:alginate lyase family protein n=1 Tax=Larkinella sp. VNQ87 TaxID=3400921 RepID=UPI003BFD340A
MLNRYHEFYYRLQSFSTAKLVARLRHFIRKKVEKKQVGWKPSVRLMNDPARLFSIDESAIALSDLPLRFPVFEQSLDSTAPIDWHLDPGTDKSFPAIYSREISLSGAAYHRARYVWEINRFYFLPTLALRYRLTTNPNELTHLTSLLISWEKANPYLTGINWHNNLEVSIRLINWFVTWNILNASVLAENDPVFRHFIESVWVPIIYQHCTYIYQELTLSPTTGHQRLAGYAALFVASSFWPFAESTTWNSYTKDGLEHAIQQQHSANGINRDEATDSIQFGTDLLLLAHLTGVHTNNPFSETFVGQLRLILSYIAYLVDRLGNLPTYGDEGIGRLWQLDYQVPTNNFQSLLTSAAVLFGDPFFKPRPIRFDFKNQFLFGPEGRRTFQKLAVRSGGLSSQLYAAEGHFILRKAEEAPNEIYIYFNAAPLGVRGHADALSFSMHIDGQPFFVDPGTYLPESAVNWRRYFTSTRAHNTVCLNELNQAVQDKALRWLNPYTVRVVKAEMNDHTEEVSATHSGYDRIGCSHQRRLEFDKLNNRLRIDDQIDRKRKKKDVAVEVLFHIHPSIRFRAKKRNQFVLSHPQIKRLVVLDIDPLLEVEVVNGQLQPSLLGWYSAGLYQKQPTCVFRAYGLFNEGKRLDLRHHITVQP